MARCGINKIMSSDKTLLGLILCLLVCAGNGKKHFLKLEEDDRKQITVSTFGFLKGGILSVDISNFHYTIVNKDQGVPKNKTLFGFTLDKSGNSGLSTYMENGQQHCILQNSNAGIPGKNQDSVSVVVFKMDLDNQKMAIEIKGDDLANLTISSMAYDAYQETIRKHQTNRRASGQLLRMQTRDVSSPERVEKDDNNKTLKESETTTDFPNVSNTQKTPKSLPKISSQQTIDIQKKDGVYSAHFLVHIRNPNEEGLYNLFFHNCLQYEKNLESTMSMSLNIIEVINGNYLSAGNQPEPTLFFIFFILYLTCGGAWLMVLRRSEKSDVFKIHYLMLAVVWVKSLSCLFHGINSHFIEKSGIPEEAWAILWYIVYLMRGALMFGTILLIGAGWAFIKHMLSKREKKLFAIFLPLQILDQVAWVIVEESDEGLSRHTTWKQIFFVVDLLCCGAILFPVVWSIRHLQEASGVDGKAAMNLNKLKLFRHFYILVVCYIYFTRMIVYLLEITLPFRHEWLKEFSKEIAVFLFFCVTGYKFQPATDNPYLQVPVDSDEDIEMEEVLTKTGTTDGLSKVNQHLSENKPDENVGIKQRESSLEYD